MRYPRILQSSVPLAFFSPGLALATNGYFAHGYGVKYLIFGATWKL